MNVLAIILRALLMRYGAEMFYRTLQWVTSRPADEQVPHEREMREVAELEQRLGNGPMPGTAAYSREFWRDAATLDLASSMDFEDRGYVWDQPCRPEEE